MSGGPRGYTIVPDALICDARLTALDFRLLVLLMSYDFEDPETKKRKGEVWPAMETLAGVLQVGRSTIFRSLLRLEDCQYLKKVRGGGGRHLSNRYKILCHWRHSIKNDDAETVSIDAETVSSETETVSKATENCVTGDTGNNSKETLRIEAKEQETEPPSKESENRGQAEWASVLDEMTFQLGRERISTLRAVTQAERRDGALVVTVRNPYQFDWLQGRARVTLERMVAALADGARLEFVSQTAQRGA